MISLKAGASIRGLRPEVVLAVVVADQVYGKHGCGDLMVTEGTGGKHGSGSLHYVGLAADLRTGNLPAGTLSVVANDLRALLGAEYDVVVEETHLHIEFQPK